MLRIGVLATLFPFVFGSLLGATAGYYGGWVDSVLMRAVDVVTAIRKNDRVESIRVT